MRRYLAVVGAVCLAVAVAQLLLLPSPILGADSWKEAEGRVKTYLQAILDTFRATKMSCAVGFEMGDDGRVMTLGSHAGAAGIQKGDQIKAYDGRPFVSADKANRYRDQIDPGSEMTLSIERDGAIIEITVTCADAQGFLNKVKKALSAGIAGDFAECAGDVRRIEGDPLGGPRYSLAVIRAQCLQGLDYYYKRPHSPNQETAFYEQIRRSIEAGKYSESWREKTRGEILTSVSWLEDVGRSDLAEDLRDQLKGQAESIRTSGPVPEEPSVQVGYGTCFVVGPTGQILTADHVVSGSDEVRVSLDGGDFVSAKVEMASPFNDLALLQIETNTPLYLPLAAIRSADTGQEVFTMGFPVTSILGEEPKFTEGSISATSGPGGEASLLQISVPVQPGNSGGPLVTFNGEVVGIITSSAAIVPFIKASGTLPQNVNWAVSADYARPMLTPPPAVVAAQSREEAIERTKKALCQVEATKH